MRTFTLTLAAAPDPSGCAKPMLDIPEPDRLQRTTARSVLDATHLEPVLPMTLNTRKRQNRVLPSPLRVPAFEVCQRMVLESAR